MSNVECNFGAGSVCYGFISSEHNRKKRMQEIVEAILTYSDDRRAWEDALSKKATKSVGARVAVSWRIAKSKATNWQGEPMLRAKLA